MAFASRTLAAAEKNYSQLEREGLAVVFGVKKFHSYLYGRHFTIYSDHQPLRHLFSESRGVPTMAAASIQRWALTPGAYEYNIKYCPGKDMANADALSRLPLARVVVPPKGREAVLKELHETHPGIVKRTDVRDHAQCQRLPHYTCGSGLPALGRACTWTMLAHFRAECF